MGNDSCEFCCCGGWGGVALRTYCQMSPSVLCSVLEIGHFYVSIGHNLDLTKVAADCPLFHVLVVVQLVKVRKDGELLAYGSFGSKHCRGEYVEY